MFFFSVFAQKEKNIWYFGNYAGISFNTNNPIPISDGKLKNYEGCASICDNDGNLIFYTDGGVVWNKHHQKMPNGRNLYGIYSATQSVIIIPLPNDTNTYYVFTVNTLNNDQLSGFHYSIVEMDADSGRGDVTAKNILIHRPVTEKLTAIKHCNNIDVWIIVHEWMSDAFHAYLLTRDGLGLTPVVSNTGLVHIGSQSFRGYLKPSPSGNKIAMAIEGELSLFQLLDFDKISGVISNPITLNGFYDAYGVAFSPNEKILYGSTWESGNLFQFNLESGISTDIINSAFKLDHTNQRIGALNLGPDNKIYVSTDSSEFLGIIHYPDSLQSKCLYNTEGIYLDGRISRVGLPNFPNSYFSNPLEFSFNSICLGDTTFFNYGPFKGIDNVLWEFDDPNSGSDNYSGDYNSSHVFSQSGEYNVKLYVYNCNTIDTLVKTIYIITEPSFDLGNTIYVCEDSSITLKAGGYGYIGFLWSDGRTEKTFTTSEEGTYWLEITNICGTGSDTFEIKFKDCISRIWVPSAFTPNNDGVNDVFTAHGVGLNNMEMYIYNRTGQIIYHSNGVTNPWNGKFQNTGKKVKEGIYTYLIKIDLLDGEYIEKRGTVNLIR